MWWLGLTVLAPFMLVALIIVSVTIRPGAASAIVEVLAAIPPLLKALGRSHYRPSTFEPEQVSLVSGRHASDQEGRHPA